MKKELLRSIIVANRDTEKGLASKMNISAQTFSKKINSNNGESFTLGEVNRIKNIYKLSEKQIVNIFFGKEVS